MKGVSRKVVSASFLRDGEDGRWCYTLECGHTAGDEAEIFPANKREGQRRSVVEVPPRSLKCLFCTPEPKER